MNILFTAYYTEQSIQRKKELDECLARNIINPLVHKIVLVADETVGDIVFPFEKVTIHRLGHRPTFQDMFYGIVPKYSDEDTINIISNSDIYTDGTLNKLNYVDWDSGIALALHRYDNINESWTNTPNKYKVKEYSETMDWDSQDVWIFKGHIKGMFANFPLGTNGCDNRIAYEMDKAGYWVFNLSNEIVCRHIHSDSLRQPRKDTDYRVQPPYRLLPPVGFHMIKSRQPLKIGHIGMEAFLTEKVLCDALKKLGDYNFIDWLTYTNAPHDYSIKDRAKFEEQVLNLSRWADVIFMQIQGEGVITKDLAYRMKQSNPRVKLVMWTGDCREELPNYLLEAAPYCITMPTNDTDVKSLREKGFDAEYLQVGFSPEYYNPMGYVNIKEPILFMGQNYGVEGHAFPNGKAREDMVYFLKDTYKERFGVYGGGWKGIESGSLNKDVIGEASIYRGGKIGINVSHLDRELYSSDRLVRMLGCGIMVLCKYYPRMEEEYTDGKHLVVWNTFEELKEKIDYYLEHEEERAAIAKSGCELVHRTGTWDKQFVKMLALADKYENRQLATPKVYHSQQTEEQWILDYFKDFKGTVLDIGANDGQTLSNSYQVLKDGWHGTLVEPSHTAFVKLEELWKDRKDIELFNIAIGDKDGKTTFYESGTHLGKGDTSLVSTIVEGEKKRWLKETFTETDTVVCKVDYLIKTAKQKTFDVISIDCEGMDLIILKQMNLKELECKMLIIEHNGVPEVKKEIREYCKGYRLLYDNNVNLCLAL